MDNAISGAGVRLHEMGYSILPIQPGTKAPGRYVFGRWAFMDGWSRYCSESPTDAEVESWGYWPQVGLGLALGEASGVVALDFDNDVDGLQAAVQKLLPPSPVRKVGRIGFTAFYRFTGQPSKRWSKDGVRVVEMLSTGTQTVLPPTIHPDTKEAYQWQGESLESFWADDLPELPADFVERVDVLFGRGERRQVSAAQHDVDADEIKLALRFIPADDHQVWIECGMALKVALGEDGFTVWDDWSAQSPKYQLNKPNELNKRWDSFRRTDCGAGTIYHYAFEHGYNREMVVIDDVGTIDWDNLNTRRSSQKTLVSSMDPDYVHDAPGLVGRITQWILDTSIQPQPDLALAAAIAAVGAVMGHRVRSDTDLRTNMLVFSLGHSACGKDHPPKAIKSLFAAAGIGHVMGGALRSDAGLLTALYNGNGRRLFQLDEIGRWFRAINNRGAASYQSEILSEVMKLFSSSNTTYFGGEYAHAGNADRKDIMQPCLCINGSTVPSRLYRAFTPDEVEDGFVPRWLVFETDNPFPDIRKSASSIEDPPAGLVQALIDIEAMPTNATPRGNIDEGMAIRPATIPMTPEAVAALDDATEHFTKMRKQAYTRGECYYALWGRAREHAIKLALCGHENGVINESCMIWACGLVDYLTHRLIERLKRSLFANEHEKETSRVLSIIEDAGGWISRSDVYKKTRSLQARQRNDIISTLIESDLIEAGVGEMKKGQTKPAVLYRMK